VLARFTDPPLHTPLQIYNFPARLMHASRWHARYVLSAI